MSELKSCPFCKGEARPMAQHWDDGSHVWWVECRVCGAEGKRCDDIFEAIEAWNTRHVDGSTSDGYHTFDELYYHRTALFACLVSNAAGADTFKSWKHSDGSMYDGMFIAGIYTSGGWCTYHCEAKWWPLFDCYEREFAPEWDGHTPSDAIHRLMTDFLPEQEVRGEVAE